MLEEGGTQEVVLGVGKTRVEEARCPMTTPRKKARPLGIFFPFFPFSPFFLVVTVLP